MTEPSKAISEGTVNLPGLIQVLLPETPFAEIERCRAIIHTLFESGFFKIKNGKATVHFDHQGTIQQIGVDSIQWKRDKDLPKLPPGVRIDLVQPNTLTPTRSGASK